jgi:hypothetical protein
MSLLGCGPSQLNLLGLQHVHFMFFEDHNPHACKAKHILTNPSERWGEVEIVHGHGSKKII